jgi:hypothetical protein
MSDWCRDQDDDDPLDWFQTTPAERVAKATALQTTVQPAAYAKMYELWRRSMLGAFGIEDPWDHYRD